MLERNPADDPDVGAFFRRLPESDYLPTWYEQRRNGALGQKAKEAAEQTAVHAHTPKTAFSDTLGRTFLTIDINRTQRDGDVTEERIATSIELDIESQQLSVTDALGRQIVAYAYDLLANRIHQSSADAGDRWLILEIGKKPLRTWDSRGFRFRYEYDMLRRQTNVFVRAEHAAEKLVEKVVYGEGQPDDLARNLRGKLCEGRDGAGVASNNRFDFKGNLLNSSRRLLRDYHDEVDWESSPELEGHAFTTRTSYDALNRPVTITAPDKSVFHLRYDEASLLDGVNVKLRGAESVTPFVTNITYNAKGQRELIAFGNRTRTHYKYDPITFRLIHLQTTRSGHHAELQDLHYTYDPIGNITSITDHAQQTVYFDNQVVSASNDYIYDAIYRLIEAQGREHIGLLSRPELDWDDSPRMNQPLPGNGQAMRRYKEDYQYDVVGNILAVIHHAADGAWRRHYDYSPSCNRLEHTSVGEDKERYSYDADGNMVRMPHLPLMEWDFKNQLHVTREQVVNRGDGLRTFYVYDSAGTRVRKVTQRPDGSKAHERIYLGGFEIYREYSRNKIVLERETLHVMDDKRRIALVETKTVDSKAQSDSLPSMLIRYQFTNHLDSSCLELDGEAAIISYEEYYPYGSTSYESVRRKVEISPKRYRFTGQERDEETGLYYNGARYYVPWLGRWTAPDPKGLADGTNLFAYCSDNPVGLRDPNGTDGEQISTTPAENEAQACLVDPSTPVPTAAEEAAQQSLPSEHPTASPAPTPPPVANASPGGRTIAPPPPVSGPDMTLFVPHGVIWNQYSSAVDDALNSDNPAWARVTLGVLAVAAAPLAGAEEYVGRSLANVPWAMENAGIGIGEHIGRADLWAEQGEYGEATVDALGAVVDTSKGMVAGLSVGAPVAGALESSAASTTVNTVTSETATATGNTTRLWRAVEPPELADVVKYGDYNIHPNSVFKRFAFDEPSLNQFIEANPGRTYTKTFIDVPTENLDLMYSHADPGGVGQSIGIDVYDHPEFYDWFDKVNIVGSGAK